MNGSSKIQLIKYYTDNSYFCYLNIYDGISLRLWKKILQVLFKVIPKQLRTRNLLFSQCEVALDFISDKDNPDLNELLNIQRELLPFISS